MDLLLLRDGDYIPEASPHYPAQLVVDLVQGPEEGLDILNPLEVGDGDTPGITEDIGNDEDPVLEEDIIETLRNAW